MIRRSRTAREGAPVVCSERAEGLGDLSAYRERRSALWATLDIRIVQVLQPPLPRCWFHSAGCPVMHFGRTMSLLERERVKAMRLLESAQVTDTYLLALARAHDGQLASFDQRLVTDAVIDGRAALYLIR